MRTVKTFIRKARRGWTCCKCGRYIKEGDEYRDVETKTSFNGPKGFEGINITHFRSCLECQKKIYEIKGPEPVSAGNKKYNLIGIGFNKGKLRLVIEDWANSRKQWADEVYNWQGDLLTIENVRFV